MPGRKPHEAVDAFLEPLREAMACLGGAHFQLSQHARRDVGETHVWTLNGGSHVRVSSEYGLAASMHFEVLDRGASLGAERFRVSTRGYLYAITDSQGHELMCAHWHPFGNSPIDFPHFHVNKTVLSGSGVFLSRAHIQTARVSLEYMVRMLIEDVGVAPACEDWDQRLKRTERQFDEFKTWE